MRLSAKDWNRYITKLSLVNEAAAKKMQAFIDANGMEDMDAVVNYAYSLATTYGEAAGELACQMYDAIVEASGKSLPPAEIAPTATYTETSIAVRGTVKNQYNTVPQTVGRLVKQVGADTTLQNAKRDGAKFAWVPHGGETCAFCITLASRGWQYISKRAMRNGHAEHIHANCHCEYAISFDKYPQLEGYDPDKYLEMYKNAEGATPAEKIKSIRRQLEEKEAKSSDLTNRRKQRLAARNKNESSIQFHERISEGQRDLIEDLSSQYKTRLQRVELGAEKAAGDVDVSGARMRLSSKKANVAIHEFAHTLAHTKADKFGLTNDQEFWNEIRRIRTKYRKALREDPSKSISFYASSAKELDEFMAEAFAHAKMRELGYAIPPGYGTDFTYSQEVLDVVNKYFGK